MVMRQSTEDNNGRVQALLDTLPGFYSDDIENDESGQILKLLETLLKGLTQFDDAVAIKNSPVMRAIATGETGLENYLPAILPANLADEISQCLSIQSRWKIEHLMAYQSPAWPGAMQLVQLFFPNKVIELEEGVFTHRVLPASRMSQLKGSTELGQNSVLGFRLEDYINRLNFSIKTLDSRESKLYLSDARVALLGKLLNIYLRQKLNIELHANLSAEVEQKMALGVPEQALLGLKTWLSVDTGTTKVIVIRL